MSLSLLLFLGTSRSSAYRLISASRTRPTIPKVLVNNEKSNGFSNIIVLIALTLETAIYRRPNINSRVVISTTAFSRVIPYALCTIIAKAIRIGNCSR